MIFLTDADFGEVQARAAVLAVLTISTTSLDTAELMAIEQVTSYLNARFDVPAVFSAAGTARNPVIIMYMIDLILYHLHSNAAGRAMPKAREDRYNAALLWLGKVATGDLIPSLPPIASTSPDPLFKFGSDSDYIDPFTGLVVSQRLSQRW